MKSKSNELIAFIKRNHGIAVYSDILKAGFSKSVIKTAISSNLIKKVVRGIYMLPNGVKVSNPDFVIIAAKIPKGVICLLSALNFYELTNEIPRQIDVAIVKGSQANKIKYPPVKFFWFDKKSWQAGIEEHSIGPHKIRIYNIAKTIADCFKFRNRIGINIVRDALKTAIKEKKAHPNEIMKYAKICGVNNIIRPIIEAML